MEFTLWLLQVPVIGQGLFGSPRIRLSSILKVLLKADTQQKDTADRTRHRYGEIP